MPANTPVRPVRRRTSRPAARKQSSRRPRRRPIPFIRLILVGSAVLTGVLVWTALARAFAPTGNTARSRFDAIVVLGSPADADGNPTPDQLARITEGVREYERGVAPHLILTGGPTRYGYVEAQVMARVAQSEGISPSSIFLEPEAHDTIHNACYSLRIMKTHGWKSAEVVSVARHLPRSAMIFSRLPLEWRTHTAPPLEPLSGLSLAGLNTLEFLKTVRYLIYADWAERCTP